MRGIGDGVAGTDRDSYLQRREKEKERERERLGNKRYHTYIRLMKDR